MCVCVCVCMYDMHSLFSLRGQGQERLPNDAMCLLSSEAKKDEFPQLYPLHSVLVSTLQISLFIHIMQIIKEIIFSEFQKQDLSLDLFV